MCISPQVVRRPYVLIYNNERGQVGNIVSDVKVAALHGHSLLLTTQVAMYLPLVVEAD